MEEQVTVLAVGTTELLALIGAMGLIIWGLIRLFLLKEMKRVSDLELAVAKLKIESVTRIEFNETIKIMRDEIRQGNDATHQGLREVHGRLDALLLKIAKVTNED